MRDTRFSSSEPNLDHSPAKDNFSFQIFFDTFYIVLTPRHIWPFPIAKNSVVSSKNEKEQNLKSVLIITL